MEKKQATNTPETTSPKHKPVRWYETWTFLIVVCIGLPLLFRSVCYSPYHIPSGSMKPTLLVGDFILVNKAAYGYSRYSFPFGFPWFEGRVMGEEPERGDVIVFRPAKDPHTDFIKRLIGLPGDEIKVVNSVLYLNGNIVRRELLGGFVDDDGHELKHYIEKLPDDDGGVIEYDVLDDFVSGPVDNTPSFTVPEGHYFLMGDNRDHSADSRFEHVGMVPFEHLVGRAEHVVISTSDNIWKLWKIFSGLFRGDRTWLPVQYEERESGA